MLDKLAVKIVFIAVVLLIATAAGAQEQSEKNRDQGGMAGMEMGGAQKQEASAEARGERRDVRQHDRPRHGHERACS